jgi:hypothetical protein
MSIERKDGAIFVTITTTIKTSRSGKSSGSGSSRVSKSKMSEEGLFLMSEGEEAYDPPMRIIPLPVKEGETWESDKPFVKWKVTAGMEEVAVPAGMFKAIRLEGEGETEKSDKSDKRTPIRYTHWYAPDIGRVKSITKLGDDEIVEVLKSFVPGPAKK